MTKKTHTAEQIQIKKINKRFGRTLVEQTMPKIAYPEGCVRVMRSRYFLVQEYRWQDDKMFGRVMRLSICRTAVDTQGRWQDKVTWDEMQRIKKMCNYGHYAAVEIFPPERHLTNVANMRHMWILKTPPEFMWMDEE